jgi:hypothetical protein
MNRSAQRLATQVIETEFRYLGGALWYKKTSAPDTKRAITNWEIAWVRRCERHEDLVDFTFVLFVERMVVNI